MKKDRTKIFWYLIAIGISIFFILIFTGSIIQIGERLRNINMYVEIAFYALCLLLIWFLIINPIRIIVFSPSLSIATTLEEDNPKARSIYKSVRKNILNSVNYTLTSDERKALTEYKNYSELRAGLNLCLNGTIKKEIRKIIVRNAKVVMISTAVSQNSKLDMYSVISVNLKMIKEIVVACGFRPSMKNLSKLTLNVATTALVAEGLESLKLEELLPTKTIQAIGEIPLLKPFMSSIIQGITNALMCIRIGLVTRGYLFSDGKSMSKNQIRIEAFKDSLTILPQVIGELALFLPKKAVRLFSKDENTDEKKLISE